MNTINLTRRQMGVNRTFLLLKELSGIVIEDWHLIYGGAVELKLNFTYPEEVNFGFMVLSQSEGIVLPDTDSENWAGPSDEELVEIVSTIQCLIDAGAADCGTLLTLNVTEG